MIVSRKGEKETPKTFTRQGEKTVAGLITENVQHQKKIDLSVQVCEVGERKKKTRGGMERGRHGAYFKKNSRERKNVNVRQGDRRLETTAGEGDR